MAKRRGFRSCRKAGMRNKGHGITSQSHRKTADSRKQHVRAACITRLVLMGGEEEVVRLFLLTAFPVMSSPLTPFPTLLTFMTIITQHLDCCRQNTAITLPSLPSKHRPCQPSQVPGSNSSLPALSHGLTVTATERSPSGVESRIAVSLSLFSRKGGGCTITDIRRQTPVLLLPPSQPAAGQPATGSRFLSHQSSSSTHTNVPFHHPTHLLHGHLHVAVNKSRSLSLSCPVNTTNNGGRYSPSTATTTTTFFTTFFRTTTPMGSVITN